MELLSIEGPGQVTDSWHVTCYEIVSLFKKGLREQTAHFPCPRLTRKMARTKQSARKATDGKALHTLMAPNAACKCAPAAKYVTVNTAVYMRCTQTNLAVSLQVRQQSQPQVEPFPAGALHAKECGSQFRPSPYLSDPAGDHSSPW
jgi:hypothetical protein